MNITLSVNDEVVERARAKADALGTSVNQLVREYLEELAGNTDRAGDAAEFVRLALSKKDDLRPWKFNRDELYESR